VLPRPSLLLCQELRKVPCYPVLRQSSLSHAISRLGVLQPITQLDLYMLSKTDACLISPCIYKVTSIFSVEDVLISHIRSECAHKGRQCNDKITAFPWKRYDKEGEVCNE
jgi:hypothetical protein